MEGRTDEQAYSRIRMYFNRVLDVNFFVKFVIGLDSHICMASCYQTYPLPEWFR